MTLISLLCTISVSPYTHIFLTILIKKLNDASSISQPHTATNIITVTGNAYFQLFSGEIKYLFSFLSIFSQVVFTRKVFE